MSKNDDLFSRFDALTEAQDAYMAKVRNEGEIIVKGVLNELFKRHPELTKLRWRQYTPHFNDGDPCHFGVRDIEIQIKKAPDAPVMCGWCSKEIKDRQAKHCSECGKKAPEFDDDGYSEDDWHYCSSYSEPKGFSKELNTDVALLGRKFSDIEDTLELTFGDNAEIIVTADNITVEEYDHD